MIIIVKNFILYYIIIYYPIEKFSSRLTDKLITITKEDYNLAHKKFRCQVEYIHGVGANSSKYYAFSDEEKKEIHDEISKSFLDNEDIDPETL